MQFSKLSLCLAAVLAAVTVNASVLQRAVTPSCSPACADGFYCGTTSCHPVVAEGGACASNRACGPSALCLTNKTCSAANPTDLPVGERCSSSTQCADQGLCQDARCIANPPMNSVATGGACRVTDQCVTGYCNRATCKAFVAPGSKCTLDDACEAGVCPRNGSNAKPKDPTLVVAGAAYQKDGLCPKLPYVNNPLRFRCDGSPQCSKGLYCHKQRCQNKLSKGQLCDKDRACLSHYCARPPTSDGSRAEKICMKKPEA